MIVWVVGKFGVGHWDFLLGNIIIGLSLLKKYLINTYIYIIQAHMIIKC